MGTIHSSIGHDDAVVVGGGFVGLAAAVALARSGARVTVLEALGGVNPAFRGELIHPRGVRALRSLGLEAPLMSRGAVPVRGFAAFRDRTSPPVLLPYPQSSGGITMEHAELVACFRRAASADPRVKIITHARVHQLVYDGRRVAGVRTVNGQEYRAPFVVAADGRHSRIRKLLGVPTQTTLLSYTVAVALEGNVLPEPEHGHVFVGSPGPILAYPYGCDRVRMCIDVPLGVSIGRDRLLAYLRDDYAPHLPGAMRDAMLAAVASAPLGGSANHAVYTKACAVPGAALVGDAGGCSHPITAAGMTTGLHDVTVLADCFAKHSRTDDMLAAYQRHRYRFVRAREAFTHSLYEVLRGEGPGAGALREGIFRYWRASERARRTSMGVLSGDEERVGTFVSEYLRVVMTSAWLTCREGRAAEDDSRGVFARLRAVVGTATDGVGVAFEKAVSTVAIEHKRSLDPIRDPIGLAVAADKEADPRPPERTERTVEAETTDAPASSERDACTARRRMTG
jgi:squalene monooxygenase